LSPASRKPLKAFIARHFSPHDAPDLLVDDIRQFFRSLR